MIRMMIDSTDAPYGLFQVAFADMAEHLAGCLYQLRLRKEPGLKFENMFGTTFGRMLKQFKDELKGFDADKLASQDLQAVRQACHDMSVIARWRNARAHARVRVVADGYALYDWRTNQRLSMNVKECESKIQEVNRVNLILETHMTDLLGNPALANAISDLLSAVDDLDGGGVMSPTTARRALKRKQPTQRPR